MEKIKKKVTVAEMSLYDLEVDLPSLIGILSDIREESKELENLHVRFILQNSDEDNEPYGDLIVYGNRLETDEELDQRITDSAKKDLAKYVKETNKKSKDLELEDVLKLLEKKTIELREKNYKF